MPHYGVQDKYAIVSVREQEKMEALIAEYSATENAEDAAVVAAIHEMMDGRKIISVPEAIGKASNGQSADPKLAFSPATQKTLTFHRKMRFGHRSCWFEAGGWSFPLATSVVGWPHSVSFLSYESVTIAPFIPPRIRQKHDLTNKFVLWEPDKWTVTRDYQRPVRPADPALLEHLVDDLYVVVDAWELSELELAVLAGIRPRR